MCNPPTSRSTCDSRADARGDAELLAGYVGGDTEALTVLVGRYHRLLLAVVRNLAWREPDPEAVVQQVWLRVLKSAHTFSGRAKVSTWLHRITVNEAITAARQRRATPAVPAGELAWDGADPEDVMGRVVDREHAAAMLAGLLAGLPRHHRLVLEVIYLDGLTYQEAAQLFGVPVGTIKSRVSRAQTVLRTKLAAHPDRDDPAVMSRDR